MQLFIYCDIYLMNSFHVDDHRKKNIKIYYIASILLLKDISDNLRMNYS